MNTLQKAAEDQAVTRQTYTRAQVAQALTSGLEAEVDPRQLEGWVNQGFLTPAVREGQSPEGNRREWGWGQIMGAAVLVEMHKLFGPAFRAGSVKALAQMTMEFYPPAGLIVTPPGSWLQWDADEGVSISYNTRIEHLYRAVVLINLSDLNARLVSAFRKG